jgi:hypothetical protein
MAIFFFRHDKYRPKQVRDEGICATNHPGRCDTARCWFFSLGAAAGESPADSIHECQICSPKPLLNRSIKFQNGIGFSVKAILRQFEL